MKMYISFDKDTLKIKGYYDDLSSNIPSHYILINEELYKYLQGLTSDFKLKENFMLKEIYTIEDKDIFEIIPFEYENPKPNRTDLLEKQNAFLIKESLEKDIEINNLNTNMAQTTLNLVNKDIQVKGIEKDIANLILKSLGGNLNG
ncbi:Uncharacterised protein [[Clostridium] sordellii]|uniref:hypothetical protein n=1 Tax=Paraclostridium sordellii TaxID=1505 RepID=UPI0005E0F953|nr:hypothetical protein [Paeniclostridium sordellii]CEN23107.1 Uncharacterised protein [[Clostridium] sordellii] [Paeniclostridium sordellii]CEN24051.1 Uncharacterised protein [[Clostridium] sordellii] [Paeniclostridium sordellii]CEN26265.1 Uncharacterised protein [[Clostridium] sordellii] [Paeniclostridium sordellii]CEQ32259.1 Uncharacterised protein [[Clostridium] sordellii] [Paeniclostridium sordellii]